MQYSPFVYSFFVICFLISFVYNLPTRLNIDPLSLLAAPLDDSVADKSS